MTMFAACVMNADGTLSTPSSWAVTSRYASSYNKFKKGAWSNQVQAIRNSFDATCISVPAKYKKVGDFHEYYSGQRMAPFLTIFCGGNHETSNYLFELYYGGWVAHNIYYLGAANVVRLGPVRICGMSGIWKGYDYRKPHYERLPYNHDELHGAHHVRELDVRKLLQIRTQVDIGLSHDWPRGIEYFGDSEGLFRKKRGFREDSVHGRLGNVAAREVLDRLRPPYWFSAHLHVQFAASMPHVDAPLRAISPAQDEPSAWAVQLGPEAPSATPIKGKPSDGYITSKVSPASAISSDARNKQQTNMKKSPPFPVRRPDLVAPPMSIEQKAQAQEKITAWNMFPAQAQRAEREALDLFRKQFLSGKKEDNESASEDIKPVNSTWTPVTFDASGRRISGPQVTHEIPMDVDTSDKVQNSDEINLDSSSASSRRSSAGSNTHQAKRVATDGIWDPPATNESLVDRVVSENVRNRLPASLARPAASAKGPTKHIPEAIHNKLTKFLALDKFGNRDPYIKLVEIRSVSDQGNAEYQRPYRLQYDKEWLAITRVFADDLVLGDPTAPVPRDLGEKEYLPLIIESEKWVEENIVRRGLLNIPFNFNRTAPKYDPKVPITTTEMPIEYNNLQTAEFCELLGIPNKFHLSEEERAARLKAGPRPCGDGHPKRRGGGRRNNRGQQTAAQW